MMVAIPPARIVLAVNATGSSMIGPRRLTAMKDDMMHSR
jgi:hypothetical protein